MTEPGDRERLALLVHEVRSPVAALAAIAGTLADGGPRGPDRAELVRLAIAACHGLERIAVDVLVSTVRREALDPGALVLDAVATARLRGADVEAQVEDDLPVVSGDPVRLRQVLDNLVANALVHSGTQGVVTVRAVAGEEGVVRLSVSDSGIGVPETEHERIFEAGARLDPDHPGSGLGLAVVRAIVEAHGGRLSLVSAPGKGATFTVSLPAG